MIHQPESDLPEKLKGLHLFGYGLAPCAQRVRFALGEKGLVRGAEIPWDSEKPKHLLAAPGTYISRKVSLPRQQNLGEAYAAIHPNMVIPALVHDGVLHLESMDIIRYLDDTWPGNRLIPLEGEARQSCGHFVQLASQLHRSVRYISFKWSFGVLAKLNERQLENLRALETSQSPEQLVAFYDDFSHDKISREVYQHHVQLLESGFAELESILRSDGRAWICGNEFSMADIVWTIKILRVRDCGYRFQESYPLLTDWFQRATQRRGFIEGVWRDARMASVVFRARGQLANLFNRGIRQMSSAVATG